MQDRVNDPATRRRVLDALHAVLSDDHNYEVGLITLRDLMDHIARHDGAAGLGDLTVALSASWPRRSTESPMTRAWRQRTSPRSGSPTEPRWVAGPIRDAPGRGVRPTAW